MEEYILELNEEEPKYIQIANHIKKLINSKIINDGEKLPPIRKLAEFLKVNNVTIINCYKKLQSEGYAYQKMGSGTFAKRRELVQSFKNEYSKEIKNIINKNYEDIIDFTGESLIDVYFPINEFKDVLNKVLDRDGAEALLIQETLGYSELRETINKVFWNKEFDEEEILILSGAQQGIDIAAKAIVNINDNVMVEKPTYGGALSVFKWRRANIFEVPINDDGIDIKLFEEILKKNKIKCFYAMSYLHNPTGISYSKECKLKILELAEKYDFYIIEDDYLSELIYDEELTHEPFKILDRGNRVFYIKSFSKIFLPGIRLGYMIYPNGFKEVMQSSKVNTDTATSTLMQRALELYIKEGYFTGHIESLKKEYKKRYNIMKKLIKDELSNYVEMKEPRGGLYFYLKLKDKNISSKELFYILKDKKIFITPGVIFYKEIDGGIDSFRLCFSQTNEEKIREGIYTIKEVIDKWHI
ncbi:PLP-dependent aminotransferase family protein [Clostridium sp. NSJ-49]|uniref:GntR family transcriptional regulator n=1 Tax=Clostridium disporicum TaxID=84024 RepID=A0A174DWT4_9CLOT|nr:MULTISPECIES: PLP-dependent aminotransferase family protein [Clostridium]MBC5626413.1 PLP-dependent aminotransferase family protein [Clostridium sp. NSJ-49]MDU6340821.1 PLP-dependent aminotransferase family protein [Clostridium sp.]CUO28678.1 GntR family transcriptional regulator [Clostridium disporicum]